MRPGPRTPEMHLSGDELRQLEAWATGPVDAPVPPHRAAIVLACAAGRHNRQVASAVGVTTNTVGMWRRRFLRRRLEGLRDVVRRPGVRPLEPLQIEEVLRRTMETRPDSGGNWSTGTMAVATGLSQSSVSRIWRAFLRERREREATQRATSSTA